MIASLGNPGFEDVACAHHVFDVGIMCLLWASRVWCGHYVFGVASSTSTNTPSLAKKNPIGVAAATKILADVKDQSTNCTRPRRC